MIDPTKLLRAAFFALALLFLAPVAGIGGNLLGVEAAQAATVSKISVVGNKTVDTAAVIKYLDIKVGDNAVATMLVGAAARVALGAGFSAVTRSVELIENVAEKSPPGFPFPDGSVAFGSPSSALP